MLTFIAVSGSLRAASANSAVLRAAAALAPSGVRVDIFDGVGNLPHFNPDIEADPPAAVLAWRAMLSGCDAVLIASPEYAHGVAGAFKNALDWVVGSAELAGKDVVLINTSARAVHAQAALAETIVTMGWNILAAPVIPVANKGLDEHAIVADPVLAAQLNEVLESLVQYKRRTS